MKKKREGEEEAKGHRETDKIQRQMQYTESRQNGVKREREGGKRLRDTERQMQYTESRQNVVKREREGEEEAEGHRETDLILLASIWAL